MKKQLHENKAALELAIVKSLGSARLTVSEVQELSSLSERDLIFDYDLDSLMAEKVKRHAACEQSRLQAQNQYTPIEGFEPKERSLTRTWPITESRNSRIKRLRRLVAKVVRSR